MNYIFHAKTRQRLLYMAMAGLTVSSFALIVLQSTMGGLQNNLMTRSKSVTGNFVLYLKGVEKKESLEMIGNLTSLELNAHPEYELEMLLKYGDYLAPVVVHATDIQKKAPEFLKGHFLQDVLLPIDISFKYGIGPGDELKLISTSHVDSLLTDIPRQASVFAGETFSTNVTEIDGYHIWVRQNVIFNLIRKVQFNRIRIYGESSKDEISKAIGGNPNVTIKSWEDENSSLVWALGLESIVMTSLFIGMTLLVALSIVSGLMIFYDKVKMDMASFWIMGASRAKLERSSFLFFNFMSIFAVSLGLLLGLSFLWGVSEFAVDIMPDIFVDRDIPVFITAKGIAISLLVPYIISIIFTRSVLAQFEKDKSFLDHVRSVG
ncbi:MAG: hypothetical protein KAG61_01750 [Bacteriovoracaceae bacterium]|nr:hypothetical protein [Bacteriovoracaceae bacterium]